MKFKIRKLRKAAKIIIVFVAVTLQVQVVFSQDSLVVISTSKYNVVYRNVPNLIKVAFEKMNEPYYIECWGGEITKIDTSGVFLPRSNFIIIPGAPRKIFISIYDITDTLNRKLIAEVGFHNVDLPTPCLYYGGTSSGTSVNWKSVHLFAKYPPSVFLDNQFKIISWEIKLKRKTYSGDGNTLSNKFIKAIEKYKKKGEFTVKAVVVGEDQVERIIESEFTKGIVEKIPFTMDSMEE